MKKNIRHTLKSHKDLNHKEEVELVLLLSFLETSMDNSFTQIRRWKSYHKPWDLNMFIVAVCIVEEARNSLKKFLQYDQEVWSALKTFDKKYRKYKLGSFRGDILHPTQISKLEDRKHNPLPNQTVINIGGYNQSKDEYTFGSNTIIVSDMFKIVESLSADIRKIFKERLKEYYETGNYEGVIPWGKLHGFKTNNKERLVNFLKRWHP